MKRTRAANQKVPKWAYLLFIILAGFVTYRLLQHRAAEIKTAQPPARPVTVAKAITKDVPVYLDEIGTCAAYETVQVQAQVSGKIIERHFQDGSDVKKGDPLFTIDPRPYQAAFDQAKAQAALDQATLKRQEDLRARKVISQQDYDTAVANAQKSQAAAEAAQVNLDYCYIKSPINGRVGLRNVDVGNLVGPSTPPLVTIQGLDPIYTDFTVAENDLPLVRKYLGGPNVKVETYLADGSITPRMGDLYFIDNAVQPGSGTVKVRGVTANADRALWPSEFVLVRFILDTLKNGIKKTGENTYEITRSTLETVLGNMSLLSRSARIVPEIRDGKAAGFRLYSVRPDGPFALIGMQNGDVISVINGLEITSPQKALEVYAKLKSASHLSVGIERNGQRVTKDYSIR